MLKIVEGQSIQYKNVVFKRYNFHPRDIKLAVEDFKKILKECNVTPDDAFFFSIENPLNQEVCDVTLFMTIREDYFENNDDAEISFQSCYSVNNLLMVRVLGEYGKLSQIMYERLLARVFNKNLKVCTPFFNVVRKLDGHSFIDIYVGIDPHEKFYYEGKTNF